MIKQLLTLISFMSLVFCQTTNGAEQDLQKGWEKFSRNNYEKARKHFEDATSDDATEAQGYLGLSFINWAKYNYEEAYENFQEFYDASKNPYPYTYALWATPCINNDYGKKERSKRKFLETIIEDPKAPSTMVSMAHYMLGQHYMSSNEFDDAREQFNKMGTIDKWQLVGTFNNVSGSGFNKKFGPLENPKPSSTFVNKNGAEVQWKTIPQAPVNKWISLSAFFAFDNSIGYGQTFVKSPKTQIVQLRIGTSGSLKAWVNDQKVLTIEEERNNRQDTYIATAKLHKGYNRLLLKIGSSEIGGGHLMVRLTDQKGNLLKDLEYTTEYQDYPTGKKFNSERIHLASEKFFQKKIKENPDALVNYLIISEAYSRNSKEDKVLRNLMKAKELASKNSFVRARLLNLYNNRDNDTKLTQTAKWFRDNDEQNYFSLSYAFYEAVNNENYTKAEENIEKLKDIYGTDAEIYQMMIKLASEQEKMKELVRLVQEAYNKYPDVQKFVYYTYLIQKKGNKDVQAAANVLEDYLDDNYSSDVIQQLANTYFEMGRTRKGYKTLETLLEKEPFSPGYYEQIASTYFGNQEYDNAEEYMKKAIDYAPFYGPFWATLGNIYQQQDETDDALTSYKKAIDFDPTQYDIRKKYRKLKGKKGIFEYFEERDVYKVFENAPSASEFPEDHSLLLVDNVKKVAYPEGGGQESHTFAVKVLNQEGIDRWKEHRIGFNGYHERLIIEKAEVIKSDGSKLSAEVEENHLVFTNLEKGDAVHFKYRIETYYSGRLSAHFWDKFYFRSGMPVLHADYQLLVPKGKNFQHKVANANIEPKVSNKEDFTLYHWKNQKQESIKHEDYMPPLPDVGPTLFVSSFPNWDYISDWYKDIATTKADTDYEVEMAIDKIFKKGKSYSDYQKVRKIYHYIVSNISYSSLSFRQSSFVPQTAMKTLNTRLGDCKDVATLFVSMCKEVGIKANWVLVNSRDNGYKDLTLPSIYFNHCIARVNLNGKDHYIELTSDKLPMSSYSRSVENSFCLNITSKEEKPFYLDPETRVKNVTKRDIEVTLKDNSVVITRDNFKTGVKAASMRSTYRDKGEKERRDNMLEAVGDTYDGYTDLKSLSFKNLKGINDTVYYKYTYEVKDPYNDVGGMKILKLPWGTRCYNLDFLSHKERNYPISYWEYDNSDHIIQTITVNIPDNMKLAEVPESKTLKSEFADYKITYTKKGKKLEVKRVVDYKMETIPPKDYDKFKNYYSKIVNADSKSIALKEL